MKNLIDIYLSPDRVSLCHLLSSLLVAHALHPLGHGAHLLGEGGGGAAQLARPVLGGQVLARPLDEGALGPLLLPGRRLEAVRLGGGVPVPVPLSLPSQYRLENRLIFL